MSYFNNSYNVYSPYHRRGFATHPSEAPHPFHFYNAPPPAFFGRNYHPFDYMAPQPYGNYQPCGNDLEEEERAALAHLRSIQERRELAEATVAREAAARARAQAEREAAIARAIQEKEAAIVRARAQAQREREQAQREREQAFVEALRAKVHQARPTAAAEYARQVQASPQARLEEIKAARRAQSEEVMKRKAEHAARRAAKYAKRYAQEQVKEHGTELDQLNGVLGALFGINLVPEAKEEVNQTSAEKQEEAKEKVEQRTISTEADKHVSFQEKPSEAPRSTEKNAFPEDINDLLTQFLGLRVEPTFESTPASSGPSGVPAGLNDFVSQFGVVFEPETEAQASAGPSEKKASAIAETKIPECSIPKDQPTSAEGSSKTAPRSTEDTPLTSFLSGATDLPPFVRDILGNIQLAGNEESQQPQVGKRDKGKGIAEGEKTVRTTAPTDRAVPAPAATPVPATPAESDTNTSSMASLEKLASIATELALVRDSFTFPDRLAFGPASADHAPSLLFNKANHQYHAQANKLLQLLLAADGVSSGGDREVRNKRKEVVRNVEKEIQDLENRRDAIWEEVRARREQGEFSEDEESLSTGTTPSLVDHEEARDVENVENTEAVEPTESAPIENTESAEPVNCDREEGFEVPAQNVDKPQTNEQAEVVKDTATKEVQPEADSKPVEADATVEKEDVEGQTEEKKEKHEDDFELL